MLSRRSICTLPITKNMCLLSNEKKDVKVVNLKLSSPQDKPLVVMLCWLLSKRKHSDKYANFYLKQGFDVLNISISPWQLMWPVKGTQVSLQKHLGLIISVVHYTYTIDNF